MQAGELRLRRAPHVEVFERVARELEHPGADPVFACRRVLADQPFSDQRVEDAVHGTGRQLRGGNDVRQPLRRASFRHRVEHTRGLEEQVRTVDQLGHVLAGLTGRSFGWIIPYYKWYFHNVE
jgi:hypothetical protein